MGKSLYRQQMSSLLSMAQSAEARYRQYLIDTFALTTKYPPSQLKTLQQCLSHVMAPDKMDDKYVQQLKKLDEKLNNQAIDTVAIGMYKLMTGPRLNRTLDLLGKEITEHGRLTNKGQGVKELTGVDIGKIIGNVKEHYFKVAGQRQVQNSSKDGLFKAVLRDVDNNKMDFIIQDANDMSIKYSDGKNKNGFMYAINGVPLEYKASLNPMHLTEKTITNKALLNNADQLIRHHMTIGNNFDKMVEDLELDICRMVVIDKIQKGFPVFVTSRAGTSGKRYILCSEMLKDLNTIAGLKISMLDQPKTVTGFEDLKAGKITLDDVRRIIKEDADLRIQIEHELSNLEMQAGEEGMTSAMYKTRSSLNRDLAAASVLKKLMGRTVKTSLWYSKSK